MIDRLRISKELNKEGNLAGKNRVAKRMKKLGIKATQAKKFKVTTDSNHSKPIAPNFLKQNFEATKPNEKYVSDIT